MFYSKRDLLVVCVLAAVLYAEQWAEAGGSQALPEIHMARVTCALNQHAHALLQHTHAWLVAQLHQSLSRNPLGPDLRRGDE